MKAEVKKSPRLGPGDRSKPERAPRFKVEPHAFGFKPEIDMDRLNQLANKLEADEVANRLDR
ncbi:MAG: hypothetical protein OXI11_00615 [Gammaproteobacteria bacterium]|nr:hypothetical protein [Gammaproteobacteria bacterium]MXW46758.1 hypothetical protein [Gammaproteobacteria bacterium]MYD03270.1 hypothetical protein [Gammaproteobacteria bacterium]MYI24194.1 hypothetical protein [Gammaproteobacteria bacterium]